MPTDTIILAAGQGARMKSSLPKVLHKLAGRPLLAHVLEAAGTVEDAQITVVTGHGAEAVQQTIARPDIHWVEQAEQRGTAHAVQQALPHIRPNSRVLVLYGDVPLIRPETIRQMLDLVGDKAMALLTVNLHDPTGYGRILRDAQGNITAIVEQKDATEAQRQIQEINTGVLAINGEALRAWLPRIGNNNAQNEYYLTDLIGLAAEAGYRINAVHPQNSQEVEGVNTQEQLSRLERYYQQQQAKQLMAKGVALADPARFDCRGSLVCGPDACIDINCIFEGDIRLGANVQIEPNCLIKDAIIGDNAVIKANTVIEGPVTIGPGAVVGPFARLRPDTTLAADTKIGNFVETKKAVIGEGSKVNHLSYVGDAEVGVGVNIGAGTITCNYDGANKHKTILGDGVFVGSNATLIAPVKIGKQGFIAAGSAISKDVPNNDLAVGRSKQRNIEGWQRPVKTKKD